MSSEAETNTKASSKGQPFKDCFARSCRHLIGGRCELFTMARPPTITVDGRCLGYDN